MATKNSFGKNQLRQEDGLLNVGDVPLFVSESQSLLAINSDSALDSRDKEGARKVQIIGIDGEFKRVSEEVFLNGTEQIVTKKEFIFVENIEVIQIGALGENQGTIRASSETGLLGKVMPGNNRMITSAMVVFAEDSAEITHWSARINDEHGGATTIFTLRQLTRNGVSRPLDEVTINPNSQNNVQVQYSANINKTSILYISATTNSKGVEVRGGIKVSLESK